MITNVFGVNQTFTKKPKLALYKMHQNPRKYSDIGIVIHKRHYITIWGG